MARAAGITSARRPETDPLPAPLEGPPGGGDWRVWYRQRQAAHTFRVARIPFDALDGWGFEERTGNLAHHSGRFFTIEGIAVQTDAGPLRRWSQPIINQPEVGILGILIRDIGGVIHCLVQAKMEPGNCNTLQLSPTVQATRSNYTKVHRGGGIAYLEYFTEPGGGQLLVDVLQSEHGAWFYQKQNRNMVVAVVGDIPVVDDFCWISLPDLQRLLHVDNLVNMDLRTVLSCVPLTPGPVLPDDPFVAAVRRSLRPGAPSAHSLHELLNWITDRRARQGLIVRQVPLAEVDDWARTADAIERLDGAYFRVIAVAVEATSREVRRWSQPLIQPCTQGLAMLFVKCREGVLHMLLHARAEPGSRTIVELAPTIQHDPSGCDAQRAAPEFLTEAQAAPTLRIRYDTVLSEEGGRFFEATNRYVIVEMDEDFADQVPPDFRWVSLHQADEMLHRSHYLNVQTRTLLAALHSLWGGAAR